MKIERGWMVVIGFVIAFGIFGALDFVQHDSSSPAPAPAATTSATP